MKGFSFSGEGLRRKEAEVRSEGSPFAMTFMSWIFRGILSFYVICLVVEWNWAEGRSAPYLETNEITYSVDERVR